MSPIEKYLVGMIICMITLTPVGCYFDHQKEFIQEREYIKETAGRHLLRKFRVKTTTSSSWSAGFFLIAGGASGRTSEGLNITFSWMNRNGEYILSDLPKEKIRIKIDNAIRHPYVTFAPHEGGGAGSLEMMYSNLKYGILHMTIHCNEKDYTTEINLNEL